MFKANLVGLAVLSLATITGCGKKEPQYLEVQEVKESPVEAESSMQAMHDEHAHAHSAKPFNYVKPDSWSEKVPSSMVLMAFQTGNPPEIVADLMVSAFPGDVGGQLANINRWRRQVGLGPIAAEAADGFITQLDISGQPAWQVDFTGPLSVSNAGEPVRMIVSAVSFEGKTWFFKLTGPESAVEAEKANYGAFLSSVNF
jgi:predicted small lipoprotein YifL